MPNAPHLIERAAARLAAAGSVPGGLSPASSAGPEAPSNAPLANGALAHGILANGALANGALANGALANGASVNGAAPGDGAAAYRSAIAMPAPPAIGLALLEKAGLITDGAGRSRVSEELWLVQRQVLRTAFGAIAALPSASPEALASYPNLLMVTSARPGEGKSFTALNLAASIARQADHAVLLIDTDVKEHSLTMLLGLREQPGLLDLAADGTLDAIRLEHATGVDGLSVLPLGRSNNSRSDLLASRHVGRLLHGMARRHRERLIILDGAPCLATSDPAALAGLMGQVIFVVEAERTQRSAVESALDLISDCSSITLVLNKMRQAEGVAFGAYAPYYAS